MSKHSSKKFAIAPCTAKAAFTSRSRALNASGALSGNMLEDSILVRSIGVRPASDQEEHTRMEKAREILVECFERARDNFTINNQTHMQAYLDAILAVDNLKDTKFTRNEGGAVEVNDDEVTIPLECDPFLDCTCYGDPGCGVTCCCTRWMKKCTMGGKEATCCSSCPGSVCCKPCHFLCMAMTMSVAMLLFAYLYFRAFTSGADDVLTTDLQIFFGIPEEDGHVPLLNLNVSRWRCPDSNDPSIQSTDWGRTRSIYAGLMLGLTFGFLDNWGLFYGMSNLDPLFYYIGSNVISAVAKSPSTGTNDVDHIIKVHAAIMDVMSGLGNTFSDLLGILVGTAALEIAKAGLGVTPEMWSLDLIAIVLGCLFGAFLPAIQKHGYKISNNKVLPLVAIAAQLFILVSVFIAGVPSCFSMGHEVHWPLITSMVFMGMALLILVVFVVIYPCTRRGGFLKGFVNTNPGTESVEQPLVSGSQRK